MQGESNSAMILLITCIPNSKNDCYPPIRQRIPSQLLPPSPLWNNAIIVVSSLNFCYITHACFFTCTHMDYPFLYLVSPILLMLFISQLVFYIWNTWTFWNSYNDPLDVVYSYIKVTLLINQSVSKIFQIVFRYLLIYLFLTSRHFLWTWFRFGTDLEKFLISVSSFGRRVHWISSHL